MTHPPEASHLQRGHFNPRRLGVSIDNSTNRREARSTGSEASLWVAGWVSGWVFGPERRAGARYAIPQASSQDRRDRSLLFRRFAPRRRRPALGGGIVGSLGVDPDFAGHLLDLLPERRAGFQVIHQERSG